MAEDSAAKEMGSGVGVRSCRRGRSLKGPSPIQSSRPGVPSQKNLCRGGRVRGTRTSSLKMVTARSLSAVEQALLTNPPVDPLA